MIHKLTIIIIKNITNYINLKKKESLLIVRLDDIGDYLLFRNFFEILKKDNDYGRYNFTLCGNKNYKNIVENYDHNYFNNYIWVDKFKYIHSKIYRLYLKFRICFIRYDILIHPTYSRTILSEDLIQYFNAEIKIGSKSDITNISKDKLELYDKMYTRLINTTANPIFEFYRNREFIEKLLGYNILLKKPVIDCSKEKINYLQIFHHNYVVIFPGASISTRRYEPDKFKVIMAYLLLNYNYDLAISGSKSDKKISDSLTDNNNNHRVHDLTGQSLIDLVHLIKDSELLITNDTVALHIGAIFNKKTICISNGTMYGRFLPYPKEITDNVFPVYPDIVDSVNIQDIQKLLIYGSTLDINEINPNKIISVIQKILNNNN